MFAQLYYFKMFCVFHLGRIFSDLDVLCDVMKKKMPRYYTMWENFFSFLSIWLTFSLAIHFMTCIWTMLNIAEFGLIAADLEKGLRKKSRLTGIDKSEFWPILIDSYYFVTTTMTTVGYGDFVAKADDPHKNSQLMGFIMILQFCGIMLFSITSQRVQGLKKDINFKTYLKENLTGIENYIKDIDLQFEGDIPVEYYDVVIESMKNKIEKSTVSVFKTDYFKLLTPRLQSLLIKEVLKH